MSPNSAHILVTGGAGFLGSYLCDRLINDGHTVVCVDNFISGFRRNIQHLEDHSRFTLIDHDIVDPLFLDHVDIIYNLACPASPIHYQTNPVKTVKTNVIGCINMLGMAKKHGAKILQASTSEVYGDPQVSPQGEDYFGNVNPFGPRSCYDEGKRTAETLFYNYFCEHEIDIRIARIFNTYGPRMAISDGRVVSSFIVKALRGDDILINGDGSQTRSFCYVSDLIDGLVYLMDRTDVRQPINIGNDDEISILQLAEKIKDKVGSGSNIVCGEPLQDDPKTRQPDLRLAQRSLQWTPKVDFDEGLDRTIDYFKGII